MHPVRLKSLLIGLSLLLVSNAHGDQAILIGGGYNINGSQGQIELNVQWVQDVLKRAELPVTTFFTDGEDPAPDVHYTHIDSADKNPDAIDTLAAQLEPVARLFGNQQANQQRFRNHRIKDVQGSTVAGELTQSLEALLSTNADEPNLIVYNGHGRQSESTSDKVTMELWDDTTMTANDLHSILNRSNAATRFVFTQCYSGGGWGFPQECAVGLLRSQLID